MRTALALAALLAAAPAARADVLINAVGFSSTNLNGFALSLTPNGALERAPADGSTQINGQTVPAVELLPGLAAGATGSGGALFTRSFTLAAAATVTLTVDVAGSPQGLPGDWTARAQIDGVGSSITDYVGHQQITFSVPEGPGAHTVLIELFANVAASSSPAFQGLASVVATTPTASVPEPGPLALAGAGAAAALAAYRVRRKA